MSRINYSKAVFTQSAPSIRQCPPDRGAEVAFAGRSNAGKSSAINTLTDNHKLARTSKTPGRTQLINYFEVGEDQYIVDLPGYGFAKVPLKMKLEWEKNLAEYLQDRECLRGLVLMMDIRHPMRDFDARMINWAVEKEMKVHILLTKADKLKKGPGSATMQSVRKHLRESGISDLVSVQMFSSLKKTGVNELKNVLDSWLAVEDADTDDLSDDLDA